MTIEAGIRTHLINNAGVNAIVGTRIFPLKRPQGSALPAITFQRVSSPEIFDYQGATNTKISRFQIDCWASAKINSGYTQARNLALNVINALVNSTGDLGNESNIGGVSIDGNRDIFDEQTEEYRVVLDFLIPHSETI